MLLKLPTNQWANDIPGYLDAAAMLCQLILRMGPTSRGCPRPTCACVNCWIGPSARRPASRACWSVAMICAISFDIGFLDWAVMPVGVCLEELGWLQCKYLEALRHAATIAGWLGHKDDARCFAAAGRDPPGRWPCACSGVRARDSCTPSIRLAARGRSPTRASTTTRPILKSCALARAVPAAIPALFLPGWSVYRRRQECAVLRVLDNPKVPTVITGYFAYYGQFARAACGDRAGGVITLRNYICAQLESR